MRVMNMGIGMRMRFVQMRWHVDMDDCKEKKKQQKEKRKLTPWMQVVDMGAQMRCMRTQIG